MDTAVFFSAFGVSAFAGLAALLRSGKPVTWVGAISALLNSGFLGLGISMVWYLKYKENLYSLLGVCIFAGLGGMGSVDFVLSIVRNNFKQSEKDKTP